MLNVCVWMHVCACVCVCVYSAINACTPFGWHCRPVYIQVFNLPIIVVFVHYLKCHTIAMHCKCCMYFVLFFVISAYL